MWKSSLLVSPARCLPSSLSFSAGAPKLAVGNPQRGTGFFKFNFIFCLFAFSRAAPTPCGGSQGRGPIGAVAAGLSQSHSNTVSEPRLQPTPQHTATPDR